MEEKKRDDRYIQIPLCLLQKTYENPYNGLNIILDFGIISYAKRFDYDIKDVGVQLMYAYYRNKKMIQSRLLNKIQRYIDSGKLTVDEDYFGFNGATNEFDPLSTSDELPNILQKDNEFREDAILRYQIAQAENLLNIKDYSIDNTIENYNKGLAYKNDFEQKFGTDCWQGVKPSQVIQFRDSCKDLDFGIANFFCTQG